MRRGDESRRMRRSVCGQNKMYPVLKGVFKLPIWAGTVVGSIPLQKPPPGYTSSCSTQASLHTHTNHKQFSARFRAAGGDIIPSETHGCYKDTLYPEMVFACFIVNPHF